MMTLSRQGVVDFGLMVEIFNRAWLGMEERINLSDDIDFFWEIAGFARGIMPISPEEKQACWGE
jgi:hypothetical protein